MNGMHGIIFSYDKENGLRELIENRVHGSIPFGGDYRIIDFILSSMVNAGVTDVGVIMHGKCQSLLDHLGSGKSWDLSRNFGGLTLLPAFAYNEQHRGDGRDVRGEREIQQIGAERRKAHFHQHAQRNAQPRSNRQTFFRHQPADHLHAEAAE